MPDPQVLISFNGVVQSFSATMTMVLGTFPSICVLETAPEDAAVVPQFNNIQTTGDLQLADGFSKVLWKNAKVTAICFDSQSRVWRISIADRRWKWDGLGKIQGQYNQRDGDGKIKNEMAPQDLAKLCFAELNETNYDISQMPNSQRIPIDWDYTSPANALQELCDAVGAVVVLGLDDTIRICESGVGQNLPYGPNVRAQSYTKEVPTMPSALVVVGAPIRYQFDIPLVAVGWDTDNTIKLLDDLGYGPNGGWPAFDFGWLNNITDRNLRDRAQASIMKWYLADMKKLKSVPGYGPIKDLSQLIPIASEQCITQTENAIGQPLVRQRPAIVYGCFYDELRSVGNNNNVPKLRPLDREETKLGALMVCTDGFSIVEDLLLVQFSEPIYKYVKNKTPDGWDIQPADLMLRTTVGVRDAKTHAWQRYERSRSEFNNTPLVTQPRYSVRDDIQRRIVANYQIRAFGQGSEADFANFSLDDNKADCDKQADFYLNDLENKYFKPDPATVTYNGLLAINLDGAIQRVEINVNGQDVTTKVSRNLTLVAPDMTADDMLQFFRRGAADQVDNRRDILKRAKVAPRKAPEFGLKVGGGGNVQAVGGGSGKLH